LKDIQVFKADGISAELRLLQDNKDYCHTKSTSDLHIPSDNSRLEILIPRSRKRQEYCYNVTLPAQLLNWLLKDPLNDKQLDIGEKNTQTGRRIMANILRMSGSLLKEMLTGEGVAIGELDDETQEDDSGSSDDSDAETDAVVTVEEYDGDGQRLERFPDSSSSPTTENAYVAGTPATFTRSTTDLSTHSSLNQSLSYTSASSRYAASARQLSTPYLPRALRAREGSAFISSPALVESPSSLETLQYRNLLNKIIGSARNAPFPTNGAFNFHALRQALSEEQDCHATNSYDGTETVARFRSASQWERDQKIGAAGELYVGLSGDSHSWVTQIADNEEQVFELLKSLDPPLPGFSLENWPSKMRRHVREHPEYRSMAPWSEVETADLTYNDTAGSLTDLLIEHGHLDDVTWRDARPKYLLEVKTTTGLCRAPFYMSKKQYRMVRTFHPQHT
jgi:hypothetical protein